MANSWLVFVEFLGATLVAATIIAFGYVTWRLAVTRAARETIGLLKSQGDALASEVASLRDERTSDKVEIAALRSEISVLREMVTHAAEVGQLREEVHTGHTRILEAIEELKP